MVNNRLKQNVISTSWTLVYQGLGQFMKLYRETETYFYRTGNFCRTNIVYAMEKNTCDDEKSDSEYSIFQERTKNKETLVTV